MDTIALPPAGPWPELVHQRAALVMPLGAAPAEDGFDAGDGWARQQDGPESLATPAAGWSVLLDTPLVTVQRPGGQVWWKGDVLVGRDWRRAARTHEAVLLVAGPFAHPAQFPAAAAAGVLRLLVAAVTVGGPTW